MIPITQVVKALVGLTRHQLEGILQLNREVPGLLQDPDGSVAELIDSIKLSKAPRTKAELIQESEAIAQQNPSEASPPLVPKLHLERCKQLLKNQRCPNHFWISDWELTAGRPLPESSLCASCIAKTSPKFLNYRAMTIRWALEAHIEKVESPES